MTSRGRGNGANLPGGNWFKWVFVLALPFGVLFAETWLNTEMLKRDLKMSTVNGQLRRLRESYDAYNVRIATLEQLDRIEVQAPDLGLVSPQPNQIKTIYYEEGRVSEAPASPPGRPILVAELEPMFPDEEPALDSTGAGERSCQTRDSNPTETGAPMGRLRETIAAACESYFGPSWRVSP